MCIKLFTVAVAAILPAASLAAVAPPLVTACGSAEAVVVGTVEPIMVTSAPALLAITVDTSIKGSLSPGAVVTSAWPGSLTSVKTIPDHYRALWFLSKNTAGMWEIAPIGGLNAPLFASGLAVPPAGRSVASLTTPGASGCVQAVWDTLVADAAHVDESLPYLTAMQTLLVTGDPAPAAAAVAGYATTVQTLAQSPSLTLSTLALAARISAGDGNALAQVAAQPARIRASQAPQYVVMALVGWRGTDPKDLASLAVLAQSGIQDFAGPASEALMMIHTQAAVPQLVKLLNSSDPAVQDRAIRGLSLFVNGAPVLTPDAVRAMAHLTTDQNSGFVDSAIAPFISITPVPAGNRPEYLSAWTAWWARYAGKLSQ